MANSIHNIGPSDSVNYYNTFVKRYDNPAASILVTEPEAGATNSLFVIDVQDDFILPPPGLPPPKFPKGYTYGRFNVEDGANMTQMLGAFIVANMEKFTKIIFSRDTHTVDHCSFGPQGGPFPNHCVANHVGSKFHDDMKLSEITSQNERKVDVIFKGCAQTTDSFGAVPYKNVEYGEKRQLGKCNMNGFTGGKYLSKKKRNFEDYPFEGIPEYKQIDETLCPGSTAEKIAAELGAPFEIKHLFPGQTSGTHNIYVVGVAGDYCVKDTAMNIMKALDEEKKINGVKINVYVLQPFVRYGFLPIQFLGGFNNVYKDESVVKRSNFTNIRPNKDINQYVFSVDDEFKKIALTGKEVLEHAVYINGILSFKDAMIANGFSDVQGALKAARETNPKFLCSFLSPVKDIINDYSQAGVKMILNIPSNFTIPMAGGSRRRRSTRRRRQNKKNRKSRRR
jgi:nicotinamidase-related amidase